MASGSHNMNHAGQFGPGVSSGTLHPGRESGGQHLNTTGFGYDQYQAMSSAANNVSVSSTPASTSHSHNYSSEGDVPMEDADPYNRTKYPSRPANQHRTSSQYIGHEGSAAAQRYSPLNMLNAGGQFAPSPKSQSQSQTGYTYQSQTPRSRQSPTRQSHFGSPQHYHDSPSKHRFVDCPIVVNTAADYKSCTASARYNPQFLSQSQNAEPSPDQYYAHSPLDQFAGTRNGKSQMTTRPQISSYARGPGAGSVPKFQKIKSVQELQPHVNYQPPFRRANPEGGFISVRDPTCIL